MQCECNFYMHWETKKFVQVALLPYLLWCNGLKQNPDYLQGMPVYIWRETERKGERDNEMETEKLQFQAADLSEVCRTGQQARRDLRPQPWGRIFFSGKPVFTLKAVSWLDEPAHIIKGNLLSLKSTESRCEPIERPTATPRWVFE